jgi:hypothetical protein
MRSLLRRKLAVLATVIGMAFASLASTPAQAADTTTTFTLTAAGGLSISAPASKSLSAGTATNAGSLTSALGGVTATDLRGALGASWTATVSSTDFTTGGATAAETIPKADVSYWSGAATGSTGTAVTTPGQLTALLAAAMSTSRTAFSAAATVGNNSSTWNPTLVVTIPSAAVVGTYTGTVTHSLA